MVVESGPNIVDIYQIKVTLEGVHPLVWRRIQVPGDFTLRQLHRVLQIAMGWEDCHLHKFVADRQSYGRLGFLPELAMPTRGNENGSVAARFEGQVGKVVFYEYDFGDLWVHALELEAISPAEPETEYPACVAGARKCPPEDCGGPEGYEELLGVLADESDPRHEELMEWVGPKFRSEAFSVEAVNEDLAELRKRMARRRTARSGGSSRVQ